MSKLHKGPAPPRGRQNDRVTERVSLKRHKFAWTQKKNMQSKGEDRSQPERGTRGVALSLPHFGEESEHAPRKPTSPKGLATPFCSKSLQPRPGAYYLQVRDRANPSVHEGAKKKEAKGLKRVGVRPTRVWHGARSITHKELEHPHPSRRATTACEFW